ncbi:MAG: hypothetical protein AAF927_24415 [Bacteroidota bacterium]
MAKLSIKEINEALAPFSEELAARMKWDELISDFTTKKEKLEQTLVNLDEQVARERKDVDRLERVGIHRFWKTLKGEKEAALAEEYLEWEAALAEREKLAGELAEIEERLQFLEARRAQLGNIDEPIEELLRLKRKAFREAYDDPAFKLETLISQAKIARMGLGSVQIPIPGLIYDLNRLHRVLELNPRRIKKGMVFERHGSNFESIEKRLDSLARSINIYHQNADKRLLFHGGYFNNFTERAKQVERSEILAWVFKMLVDVKTLNAQAIEYEEHANADIKAAQAKHKNLLLNL